MSRNSPNLYLVGFMGVGKSAVGRHVARQLGYQFIDSDYAIERQEQRTIREIFESDGEDFFRDLEKRFIEGGHAPEGCVVACGGGLPIPDGRRELLLRSGIVVCLFANAETIIRRTSSNHKRPLLNCEDPEARVRSLLEIREPIYLRTGIGVSTEGRTLDEVAANVVRVYRREVKAREREAGR
jgi:shikimate kinase